MRDDEKGCVYCCQKCTMFIPVLFVLALIGWSYYAFMIAYGSQIEDTFTRVLIGVLYHIILILFLWSYMMAIFTAPGKPPEQFYLTEDEYLNMRATDRGREVLHSVSARVTVNERTGTGAMRYCDACKAIKPDRAHHCSMCMQCVTKMDHHCPWVGNCVGFTNYKYFVQFLFYTCLYTLFLSICVVPYIANVWQHRSDDPLNFHVLIMFLISVVFFLTVLGLFGFHLYLLSRNKTTLESSRPPCFRGGFADSKHYDLGFYENFRQVFGKVPFLWPFPISSGVGTGWEFETRGYTNTGSDIP